MSILYVTRITISRIRGSSDDGGVFGVGPQPISLAEFAFDAHGLIPVGFGLSGVLGSEQRDQQREQQSQGYNNSNRPRCTPAGVG